MKLILTGTIIHPYNFFFFLYKLISTTFYNKRQVDTMGSGSYVMYFI